MILLIFNSISHVFPGVLIQVKYLDTGKSPTTQKYPERWERNIVKCLLQGYFGLRTVNVTRLCIDTSFFPIFNTDIFVAFGNVNLPETPNADILYQQSCLTVNQDGKGDLARNG